MNIRNKTIGIKLSLLLFLILSIINSLILVSPVFAVDVDFYDTYTYQQSSIIDKILWVDTYTPTYLITIGVSNHSYTLMAYCTNRDRLIDSVFEFCISPNSTYRTACSGATPIYPVLDTSGGNDWYEASVVDTFLDIGSGGNSYYNDTKQLRRSQIQYFGKYPETNNEFGHSSSSASSFRNVANDNRLIATNFTANNDYITAFKIRIDIDDGSPGSGEDIILHLRSSLSGANISNVIVQGEDINDGGWTYFNISELSVTIGNEYFIVTECDGCTYTDDWQWNKCNASISECNKGSIWYDNRQGAGWIETDTNSKASLTVYGNDGCEALGTSANSNDFDYYFIDETFNVCDYDRSVNYEIRGYYGSTQHILVDDETCATNLVCDTDHDGQTSTVASTKPSHPCKIDLDAPLQCSNSTECWNDNVCSGARFDYGGLCDGLLIDLVIEEYADNCGGDGVLVTIDTSDQDNTCLSKGYPSGYRCDETLDDVFYDTESEVYSTVCKGDVGNSCTLNSDCYHSLDCINNFCSYGITAIFTDDDIDNKILISETIYFNNSLSTSSDDDIQYSCWKVNNTMIECDGNSTQCSSYCNSASYDNIDWDDGFIHSFTYGFNDLEVSVTIGNGILYNDSYNELYCIGGNGFYCFNCYDNLLNDDETSTDWGGHCGTPYFLRCNNDVLDNATNETSIDYGGVCGNCDNTSIIYDERLNFLIESNLIIYPFNSSQCVQADEIQGGVVMFVLVVSGLLILPLLIIIIILILFIVFSGIGGIGILFGVAKRDSNLLKSFVLDKINGKNDKKE